MTRRFGALFIACAGISTLLAACFPGGTGNCSSATCAGCCDSAGRCQPGTSASACGVGGAACSACAAAQTCGARGACTAASTCSAANCAGCCASNGACITPSDTAGACGAAGGACQVCSGQQACTAGTCQNTGNCSGCLDSTSACQPGTSSSACGSNGASCAVCGGSSACTQGHCSSCTPQCAGLQCGPDSCGGSCGTCPTGNSCNASGQCVPGCTPQCAGKQCGPDTCGGSCGGCAAGQSCGANGQCAAGSDGGACLTNGPALEAACVQSANGWGSAMSAAFGRIDGTLVAIARPSSSQCNQSNSTHFVVEVTMGGQAYPLVVNVSDTQSPSGDVYFAETDAPLVGVPWQDGWHTDAAEKLDYVNNLSVHSTAFSPYAETNLVDNIICELVPGDSVSIYALGWGTNGGHDIHRNTGGGGADGAVVLHANTSNPHYLMFRFVTQSF